MYQAGTDGYSVVPSIIQGLNISFFTSPSIYAQETGVFAQALEGLLVSFAEMLKKHLNNECTKTASMIF